MEIVPTEEGLYKACRGLAAIAIQRQHDKKEEEYETACFYLTRALLNLEDVICCLDFLRQGFRYLGYYPIIKGEIICQPNSTTEFISSELPDSLEDLNIE